MRFATPSFRLAQAALASLIFTTASAIHVKPRATVCNGSPALCSRSYGTVAFVGAHGSYAVGNTNVAANQDYDVTQQLNDGIRVLANQAHRENDGILLCHTNCFIYNGGPAVDYLRKVKTWLDRNPNEVVTIVLVNIDNIEVSLFGELYEAAGLVEDSYVPPQPSLARDAWPTLGELIDSGKRLITFIDNGAEDGTALNSAPFMIDEFSNVWETAFNVLEASWPCTVNRTRGQPENQLYMINHFLNEPFDISGVAGAVIPAKSELNRTNAEDGFGSLGQEVANCEALWGRPPNFMLVDFYSYGEGSVFRVAAQINGVEYDPATPIAPPNGTSTSTGGRNGPSSVPLPGNHASLHGSPQVVAAVAVMTAVFASFGIVLLL